MLENVRSNAAALSNVSIKAESGGDVKIRNELHLHLHLDGRTDAPVEMLVRLARSTASDVGAYAGASGSGASNGEAVAGPVDAARELLRAGFPKRAIAMLEALLDDLPAEVKPLDLFRIRANIGFCYVQLADLRAGLTFIDEAIAAAPGEPKAIAMKVFAAGLRGQNREAVSLARAELVRDPGNVDLAAQLIEVSLPAEGADLDDVLEAVPLALREKERVCVAICHLHRTRDETLWWNKARSAARRFPKNEVLRLFAAEADVDEISRSARRDAHRPLTAVERKTLREAAEHLEAVWRRIRGSEVPQRTDGLSALATAMIARATLEDRDEALALAADLVTNAADQVGTIVNALQVALLFGDETLADAASAKLPDVGPGAFSKGVRTFNAGDWGGAVRLFLAADVPEVERRFVDTVVALAPYAAGAGPADAADVVALGAVREAASGDARSLAIVARVARLRAAPEVERDAFADALAALSEGSTYPDRIMVASFAAMTGAYDKVIKALDGRVDTGAFSPELQWLADAHGSERPPRKRNVRFFEGLAPDVRRRPSIARAHGAALMTARRPKDAVPLLRRAIEAAPDDVYVVLVLTDALRQSDRAAEAVDLVRGVDDAALVGPLELKLQFVRELVGAGERLRARDLVYSLLRAHPHRASAALAYVQLLLGNEDEFGIEAPSVVGDGCWVLITSEDGERDAFMIEEGGSFLGIDVANSDSDRARRARGLRVDDIIEVGVGVFSKLWTVAEVDGRYGHVLRVLLDTFGSRYPSQAHEMRGLRMVEGDVQPVFDLLQEQDRAKREAVFNIYVERRLPLGMAARAVGSDVPSFAVYLRLIGVDVAANAGNPQTRFDGPRTATSRRGAGAVLDTFTAIACAEMDLLPLASSWFGSLVVPRTAIDELDTMAARVEALRGKSSVTIAWIDDKPVSMDHDDDALVESLHRIVRAREAIESHCSVTPVVLTDDVDDDLAKLMREAARDALDAVVLAAQSGRPLLSDDLHLRDLALSLQSVQGVSLSAMVEAALEAGAVAEADAARMLAGLAMRRHGHLWIDLRLLQMFYEHCDEVEFRAVCSFIGGAGIDLTVHWLLVSHFLALLWKQSGRRTEALVEDVHPDLCALARAQ